MRILLATILFISSCTAHLKEKDKIAVDIVDVVDITDKRLIYPDPQAILRFCKVEQSPEFGYAVTVTAVTDRLHNQKWRSALPPSQQSISSLIDEDEQQRNKEIVRWYKQVQNSYTQFYQSFDTAQAIPHSEVVGIICEALQQLAASHANKKILLVHGDGQQNMKNSEPLSIVLTESIKQRKIPIQTGIRLVFIYKATSMEDDLKFRNTLIIYTSVLTKYGISVEAQAQNEILNQDV
jgi:hypothetical protein